MAVRDIVVIGVIVFAFSIGFFILHYAMNTTVGEFLKVPQINQSEEVRDAFSGVKKVTSRLDYFIFALFIALILSLIITGWLIGGIPIFVFIYLIVVVLVVIISTVLSNIWETTTQMPIFGVTIAAFPITNNIMLNLPIYMAVVGFIGMVVMFGKPQSD